MDSFPFTCSIQVRWRDLDAYSHVNNATFATYLETARAELWRAHFGGRTGADTPFVVARLEVDYRRPVTFDHRVAVGVRVEEVRGASFTLAYRVEADGELAARARTVHAFVDPATGGPQRVPDEVRAALLALKGEGGGADS